MTDIPLNGKRRVNWYRIGEVVLVLGAILGFFLGLINEQWLIKQDVAVLRTEFKVWGQALTEKLDKLSEDFDATHPRAPRASP